MSDKCYKIFWRKISDMQCSLEKEIELDWVLTNTQQQIDKQVNWSVWLKIVILKSLQK